MSGGPLSVDPEKVAATASRLESDPEFRKQVAERLAQQGLDPKAVLAGLGAAVPEPTRLPPPPAVAPPTQPIRAGGQLYELALQALLAGRK